VSTESFKVRYTVALYCRAALGKRARCWVLGVGRGSACGNSSSGAGLVRLVVYLLNANPVVTVYRMPSASSPPRQVPLGLFSK
jgi:hypothetical protein